VLLAIPEGGRGRPRRVGSASPSPPAAARCPPATWKVDVRLPGTWKVDVRLPGTWKVDVRLPGTWKVDVRLPDSWKVDVRLPGKGNSNSHGARPVHQIISMTKWIRTSKLSIKNSLSDTSKLAVSGHRHNLPVTCNLGKNVAGNHVYVAIVATATGTSEVHGAPVLPDVLPDRAGQAERAARLLLLARIRCAHLPSSTLDGHQPLL